MLSILFKGGDTRTYKEKQYTDYLYDGKYFIVIKKKKWIGMYNLDCIVGIEVDG